MLRVNRLNILDLALLSGLLPGCHLLFGSYELGDSPPAPGPMIPIKCEIDRDECIEHSGGPCQTQHARFTATTCGTAEKPLKEICKQAFCSASDDFSYKRSSCSVFAANRITQYVEAVGACLPAGGERKASIGFRQRFRICTTGPNGRVCNDVSPPSFFPPANERIHLGCYDLSNSSALDLLVPSVTVPTSTVAKAIAVPSVEINQITLNAPQCEESSNSLSGKKQQLNYAVPPGTLGTASFAGTSVNLNATQGMATVRVLCEGEFCDESLSHLAISFADTNVAGIALTGLNLQSVEETPFLVTGGPTQQIAPGALKLSLRGRVNGVPAVVPVENSTPWDVEVFDQQLHLTGGIDVVSDNASGQELTVHASVNLTAPRATDAQLACASAPVMERVFGFEDRSQWSSPEAALSPVTSGIREGCAALGIAGHGFMNLASSPFATTRLSVKPALSVDLFIPNNQPNPSYLGALQLYLSCPSAAVTNQYVGQALLTGRPQNQFSTLRIPLPAATQATLRKDLNDCSFKFGLNANPTNRTWILDNLRFTP